MDLDAAYRICQREPEARFRLTFTDGTVRHARIGKSVGPMKVFIVLARRTSLGGYSVSDRDLASIERTR